MSDGDASPDRAAPPRVSVVLPTYRRPEMLERALGTVVAQTYRDWELIVVDDNGAGTEAQQRTEALVRASEPAVRPTYLVHEQNRGGAAARNTGIRHARGEFVAFLDDDDAWAPEKLELQVGCFDENGPDVALVYCRAQVVDETTGTTHAWATDGASHTLRDLLRRNTVGSTSLVVCRREALLEIGGFDERLPAKQDVDLYVRLAQRYRFAFVDRVLHTGYRHAQGSIGKSLDGTIRAHEVYYAKHAALIEAYPEVRHYRWFAYGRLLVSAGRLREGRAALGRAWRARPASLRTALHWLSTTPLPGGSLASWVRRLRARRHRPARSPDADGDGA